MADTYNKEFLGTAIGSNLGNGVFNATGNGMITYGHIRDIERLRRVEGFNVWCKGYDPSYMRQTILTNYNVPIRIGEAIVIPGDAVLAVGLTDFGAARVEQLPSRGMLSLIEKISEKDGSIGCAVFSSLEDLEGYMEYGKDKLILLNVKSGEPITYYVGAGWSQDERLDEFSYKWPNVIQATKYESLNVLYR